MAPAKEARLIPMLRRPLADGNFRRLIVFLGTWNLAVNLAAPFFTVFMLTTLHMDMTSVMTMSVVSLIPNVPAVATVGPLRRPVQQQDDPGDLRADVHLWRSSPGRS